MDELFCPVVVVSLVVEYASYMQQLLVDHLLREALCPFSHLDDLADIGLARILSYHLMQQEHFVRTVFWNSMNALAWRVKRLISLEVGAQLTSTSGKLLRPSAWLSSYDSTT